MGFDTDVLVVGAGFGGLATALRLAERGHRVTLCEALRYPGGCASTFSRRGHRFEAGATLFSGFGPGQLFDRWIRRYGIDVELDWLDPVVALRAGNVTLAVPPDRGDFVERICALPGAPAARVRAFFAEQRRVANTLWALFDDPRLLPPFGARGLWAHLRRTPRYVPLLAWVGRPLTAVLHKHGLADWSPLRVWLDGLCQITVQCSAAEAEAPFALATMDYYFRGTAHVRHGIGALATGLTDALTRLGAEVRFSSRVKGLQPIPGGWRAETRGGPITARRVALNLIPQAARRLLGWPEGANRGLDRRAAAVADGWGAAMLYLAAEPPPGAPDKPQHLQCVLDPSRPLQEGNHIFCSISGAADRGRAPGRQRTLTVSTHVPMATLRALPEAEQGAYIERIQHAMRATLAARAPEWSAGVRYAETASPRTFERFTGRDGGLVGGIPRRVGLRHYLDLVPRAVAPGLHLVGDSVFPGQSTLATAVGGWKLAERLHRALGAPARAPLLEVKV